MHGLDLDPLVARLNEAVAAYRDLVALHDADPTPAALADVAALHVARAELAAAVERFALESTAQLTEVPPPPADPNAHMGFLRL